MTGFQDVHGLFGGPSYVPGTNYAVAAATSAAQAVGGPAGINLPQQLAAYAAFSGGHADPNALYVVMIGGNDVRNATLYGTGAGAVATGVQTELAGIQGLLSEGARNLLVVNVPNVGIIPEFAQDAPALAGMATQNSVLYNTGLASGLAGLSSGGARVSEFDLFTYNNNISAHPGQFGLTDAVDRCYTTTPLSAATSPQCGPGAVNIGTFVYWDSIHPTATVHALWAAGMEQTLVPEPASLLLLGSALGLVWAGKRRARA